jgi:hypothetical protein
VSPRSTSGREPTEHDRRRLRQSRRVLAVGGGVAVAAAAAAGLAGLPGQVGAIALLSVGALAVGVAGLHLLVRAMIDDLRDLPVARRRPVLGVGGLLLAGVLMAMAGGVAAG